MHYNPNQNNVAFNQSFQGIDTSLPRAKQEETPYPAVDRLRNATINDDFIYLSTTDRQHECYKNGNIASSDDYTSFSGYFTSEATAKNRINQDGTFDAYSFHRDLCVAPTRHATESDELMDKRHLDYFYIDRDRMEQIYGTRDFNAAIGKCSKNNHFGPDGGDQGYNAFLTELYNNGCLKYAGTYDADPASTLKFRDEYEEMCKYRKNKCSAIMSGESSRDVQKIGYPLDSRCHKSTSFDSEIYPTKKALNEHYGEYTPSYNSTLAESTNENDRKFSQPQSSNNSSDPNGKIDTNTTDGFYDAKISAASNSSLVEQGIEKTTTGFNM